MADHPDHPTTKRPRLYVWNQSVPFGSPAAHALEKQFDLNFSDTETLPVTDQTEGWAIVALSEIRRHRTVEQRIFEHHAAQALQHVSQPVFISNFKGELIWSNMNFRQLNEALRAQITAAAVEAGRTFAAISGQPTLAQSQKFEFETADDENDDACYEMICSPALDPELISGHREQIVSIIYNNTREKHLQRKIDAIDAAGSELVRIESEAVASLNTADRLALLEDNIIKYTRDLLDFDHFNIYLLEQSTNRLLPVMVVGMPAEVAEYKLYASVEGSGISGTVAATAKSIICSDVSKEPRYLPGLENAASSLSVPLRLHDKVVGVFNVESIQLNNFTEEDRQFAEIFGRYVALALNILDLLVVERCATSGTVAVNVIGEVDQPLNDITAEAQILRERFLDDPESVQSLDRVLTLVENVRSRVRDVAQGPKSILGVQAELSKSEIDPLFVQCHVLIADDEANIRNTIANVFKKRGAEVTVAENGSIAIEALENSPPGTFSLVLSDISMPDRNGYEVFAAARQFHHQVPVILMTGFGYDPHHSIVRASQEGLQCVLFKPFQIDQLIEEVTKALTGNRPNPA